jgi:hypothetical protein
LNWKTKLLKDNKDGDNMLVVIFCKTKQLQWMMRLLKTLKEMVVKIVLTAVMDVDGKISAVGSDGNKSVSNSMDIDVENLDYDYNNSFSLSEQ